MSRRKTVSFTGIDPGLTGAGVTLFGHLDRDCTVVLDGEVTAWTMPTIKRLPADKRTKYNVPLIVEALANSLGVPWGSMIEGDGCRCDANYVTIERAQVRPGQGRTTNAKALTGQVAIEAACQVLGFNYELVYPSKWKNWAGLSGRDKKMAVDKARELNDEWRGGQPMSISVAMNVDLADAFCIAMWRFATLGV